MNGHGTLEAPFRPWMVNGCITVWILATLAGPLLAQEVAVAADSAVAKDTTAATGGENDCKCETGGSISAFFGAGIGVVWEKSDIEQFKIVGPEGARVIVQESNSRSIPQILTGIKIQFGNPQGLGWHRLAPSSMFVSAELSASDVGPVSGVSMGLGWKIFDKGHLLLGISSLRSKSLREDLRPEWKAAPNNRLPLPLGENAESILGTEGANTAFIALAVPVDLRSIFGGGGSSTGSADPPPN